MIRNVIIMVDRVQVILHYDLTLTKMPRIVDEVSRVIQSALREEAWRKAALQGMGKDYLLKVQVLYGANISEYSATISMASYVTANDDILKEMVNIKKQIELDLLYCTLSDEGPAL